MKKLLLLLLSPIVLLYGCQVHGYVNGDTNRYYQKEKARIAKEAQETRDRAVSEINRELEVRDSLNEVKYYEEYKRRSEEENRKLKYMLKFMEIVDPDSVYWDYFRKIPEAELESVYMKMLMNKIG